ncbi:MAG: ion transporter [Planctomycetota bacterium]
MSKTNSPSRRTRWSQRPENEGWRRHLYDVIFEAEDRAGKWFDIALLLAIIASITIVSLETVPRYRANPTVLSVFEGIEWFLTILFTIEYGMRLCCVRNPLRYAFSFWGLIDLLSILPTYITHFVGSGSRSFVILRSVRLLRVFRVLKLWRMMDEADELSSAIWRARNKIIVFLVVVLVAVTISGTLMYHIEALTKDGVDEESLFTSIPEAMYWAIVTMTTVGYGDVVPKTAPGKVISAILILLGYSLIIVPSTFVSAEIVSQTSKRTKHVCKICNAGDQREDAMYCYRCGERLE